jgi:hypothetical protein
MEDAKNRGSNIHFDMFIKKSFHDLSSSGFCKKFYRELLEKTNNNMFDTKFTLLRRRIYSS